MISYYTVSLGKLDLTYIVSAFKTFSRIELLMNISVVLEFM